MPFGKLKNTGKAAELCSGEVGKEVTCTNAIVFNLMAKIPFSTLSIPAWGG